MHTPVGSLYRFGPFQVNSVSGELWKNGNRVKLQEQPFRLLVILLENAGEVVTRDDLRHRIWRDDTFVDFDSSLRVAVGKLREALGDDAESPRYVETIPKRGYRFLVSEVRQVDTTDEATETRKDPGPLKADATPVASVDVEPDRDLHRPQMWLKFLGGVLAIAVFVLGGLAAYRWYRQQRPQEQAALTAVPFTALPGEEASPAFSPDGSRIAFAWNGDPAHAAKGFDLYVKALGSETLLRLTRHPSEWISPAWSPDGTQIALQRMDGADTGIYVVPALGGPERKLLSTRMHGTGYFLTRNNFALVSWSPDGKWIAYADVVPEEEHARIYLLSTERLETRRIPLSPMCAGEGLPAFSHNGEYLAYWCFRDDYRAQLYSLSLPDGKPKMITPFRAVPKGLTWSADDKKLIYSLWHGFSGEFGEVTVADGSVKRLAVEGSAVLPTVSPKGDKLAYSSLSAGSNICRKDLLHPETPAVEPIPSSRAQFDAQYSPDGKRIAFASIRSGRQGVWISSDDGSNLVQISNPNYASGSPQWSPDGSRIAFDSLPHDRWEIYVADVAEVKPRKLITNISGVSRPHWSRDGKWIYFRSDEAGRTGVYRCPATGGDAIALSHGIDAVSPQESFDGKTLYFASHRSKSTLKRLTLSGQPGTESELDGLPRVRDSKVWALFRGGIYFVPAEAPRSLRYFDFATRQIRPIFDIDKDFVSGLSLSPDGRWILYSQAGEAKGDIMLVEHFH